jgi:hypothetical protein
MILFKSKMVFVASFVILISCKFHSRNDLGTFKRLSSKKYTFLYPAEWKLDSSGKLGVPLIIYNLKESPSHKLPETIALIVTPVPDSLLDKEKELLGLNEGGLSGLGNNLVLKKEILADSIIFCRAEYERIDKGALTKCIQGMWVDKHDAYQLICSSQKDRFEKFHEIFDTVFNSFTLIH